MIHRFWHLAARSLFAATLLAAQARGADLTVFAAASTSTALTEIAADWEDATGGAVTLSFAGSSVLARQIAAGAPADVFLSANPQWMDDLERRDRLVAGTRRDVLGNSLVLVATAGDDVSAPESVGDLPDGLGTGRIAMALVDAVPAGIYGKAALMSLGIWDEVSDRVAQTDNVRAALALVATGATPLGIVYGSDARAEPRVHVVAEFPPASHPPIVYPAAAISGPHAATARRFLDHLTGHEARASFARQGFTVRAE